MVRALLLISAAVLPYLPSLYGTPVYDDLLLQNNEWLQRSDWKGWIHRRTWRVLSYLSYMLNVRIFGPLGPSRKALFGFHAGNILIHIVNAFVLWWVLLQFSIESAFPVALIFAVHPLCTQGVAYITGRFSSLAATFGFIGLGLIGANHAVLASIAIVLACAAKEDAAVLFPLMSFAGAIFGREWVWFPMLVLVSLGVWYRKPTLELIRTTGHITKNAAGFPTALKTPWYQIASIVDHFSKLPLLALGLKQSANHALPTLKYWKIGASTIVMISSVWLSAGHPLHTLALAMVVLPLLPYLLIPTPEALAEQRLYIPAAGIAIVLGLIPTPAFYMVAVVFMGMAFNRSWYWRSGIDMWLSVLNGGGREDYALINVGAHYYESGDRDYAETFYVKALELNPNLADARMNLAVIARDRGKWQLALEIAQEAVRRCPDYPKGWWYIGFWLCEPMGLVDQAADAYERCVSLSKMSHAANRLGLIWAARGNFAEAAKYFNLASGGDPHSIAYRYNNAKIMELSGKRDEAMAQWKLLPKQIASNSEMLIVKYT